MAKDIVSGITKIAKSQGVFVNLVSVFIFAIVLGIGISAGNWLFDAIDRQLNISKRVDLPGPEEKVANGKQKFAGYGYTYTNRGF